MNSINHIIIFEYIDVLVELLAFIKKFKNKLKGNLGAIISYYYKS